MMNVAVSQSLYRTHTAFFPNAFSFRTRPLDNAQINPANIYSAAQLVRAARERSPGVFPLPVAGGRFPAIDNRWLNDPRRRIRRLV